MKTHHKLMMKGMGGRAYEVPAYTNAGGTGDRQALITASCDVDFFSEDPQKLVDGIITVGVGNYWGPADVSGKRLILHFANPVLITEMKYYRSVILTDGTWRHSVRIDGGPWVNIGNPFVLGGGEEVEASIFMSILSELASNTQGWNDYSLLGVEGSVNTQGRVQEFELKIGNAL